MKEQVGSPTQPEAATAPVRSKVEVPEWYKGLDDGIRFAVRVLHAHGIDTGQSCEGGEGHSYDRPTVDLLEGTGSSSGFAALAALEEYGLRVRDLALHFSVDHGLVSENFWRLTLWQPWPGRADEVPMFEWSYQANDTRPEHLGSADASGEKR